MHHRLRATAFAIALAAFSVTVGTASAAPPLSYDQEAVSRLNAANGVETIRHLAVDIGPRRSATPEERVGAEYLKGVLETYGFEVQLQSVPFTGTRNTAKVTSPNATLPNGPNWQMSSSLSGKITGDSAPLEARVVYAGTGATAADFPADSAGKIVLMDQGATTAARNTQVANAVTAGAVAVILAGTGATSAPTTTITITPARPDLPILGGGRAHLDWIKGLLAAGPLTLRLVTNSYVNHPRTNVIGIRKAVGDPTGTTAPIVMVGAHIDSVLGAPGRARRRQRQRRHDGDGARPQPVPARQGDPRRRLRRRGGRPRGRRCLRRHAHRGGARALRRRVADGHGRHAVRARRVLGPGAERRVNFVVDQAYKAAARAGFGGLQNCFLGQSDHQAFFNAGIPASLFIWLNYRKPAAPADLHERPVQRPTTRPSRSTTGRPTA